MSKAEGAGLYLGDSNTASGKEYRYGSWYGHTHTYTGHGSMAQN